MKLSITKITNFIGHSNAIYNLVLKSSQTFYSAGADGQIVEWDLSKPEEGILVVNVNQPIYALKLWKHYLLAGLKDGHLLVIDTQVGKEIKRLVMDENPIFSLAFLGDILVIGTGGGKVKLLNQNYCPDEKIGIITEKQVATKAIRSIAVHNQQLFFGSTDLQIYVTDFQLNGVKTISAHEGTVFALAATHKFLISGSKDAMIKLFDLQNYELLKSVDAHWYHVKSLSYCAENGLLLSTSMDKSIRIWQPETMELLKVIDKEKYDGHTSSVNCGLWLDENTLISCSDDRSIMAFKVAIEK